MVWKWLYPVGIHFGISQIISYLGVYLLVQRTGADMSAYYQQVLMLTGLTGILAALPCMLLYRGDFFRRQEGGILNAAINPVPINAASIKLSASGSPLHFYKILGFLITGAFLGQYGNLLVGLFQQYLNPEAYQETQSLVSQGKSIWSLIFWMGIVAPFAEEVIFRWMVYLRMRDNMRVFTAAFLSGLAFGIYHMNLYQGCYAFLLGLVLAYVVYKTNSIFASAIIHFICNSMAVILSMTTIINLEKISDIQLIGIGIAGLVMLVAGLWFISRKKNEVTADV